MNGLLHQTIGLYKLRKVSVIDHLMYSKSV